MPRVKTFQIVWHDKLPVLSCNFHASGALITSGADHDVKVWDVQREDEEPIVRFRGTLKNHSKAVNCVRCKGDALVTAGDGGEMMVWGPSEPGAAIESWKVTHLLRGHADDVTGVAWSPDGTGLMSASIENTVILWDVGKGKRKKTFSGHRHYVQGVAWDPLGELILTQSTDRTMRVLRAPKARAKADRTDVAAAATFIQSQVVYKHVIPDLAAKGTGSKENTASGNAVAAAAGHSAEHSSQQGPAGTTQRVARPDSGDDKPAAEHGTAGYIFQDESLNTFFRRLDFSPEGSFVVAPAASLGPLAPSSACASAVAVFSRNKLSQPAALLPTLTSATTCVAFCPVIFQSARPASAADADMSAGPGASPGGGASPVPMQSDGGGAEAQEAGLRIIALGYKLVFAVGSTDSVFIYDTESPEPLLVLGAIHFKHVTDLAWSPDGRYLVASSHDGYCTVAAFAEGELGVTLQDPGVTADALRARISEQRNAKASVAKKRGCSKGNPSGGDKIRATSANDTPTPEMPVSSPADVPASAQRGSASAAPATAPSSQMPEIARADHLTQQVSTSASESPLQAVSTHAKESQRAATASAARRHAAEEEHTRGQVTGMRCCEETNNEHGNAAAPSRVPEQPATAGTADTVMTDAGAVACTSQGPSVSCPSPITHAQQGDRAAVAAAPGGVTTMDVCDRVLL